ncbi:MAG: hypothetical protein V3U76_06775 [Granulosicoccus sp.]
MKTSLLLIAGCLAIGVITGATASKLILDSSASSAAANTDAGLTNDAASRRPADAGALRANSLSGNGNATTSQSATQNPFASVKPVWTQVESADANSGTELQAGLPTELSSSAQVMLALQIIARADSQSVTTLATSRPRGWQVDVAEQLISRSVFERWAVVDLQAALAWLGEQLNDDAFNNGQELITQSVFGIAAVDADALQDWIEKNAPEEWTDFLADITWREQGRGNPESALARLGVDENIAIQQSVFVEWAIRDPDAALDWLQNRASADERDTLTASAIDIVLEHDPDMALELIRSMADNSDQPWLMARYAGLLAETDPAAAAALVMNETDPELQIEAFSEISWRWAESDPQALLQFIEAMPNALQRQELFLTVAPTIAAQFSEENPQGAMQWVDSLAPGEREIALPHAFDQWLYTESEAALAWLETQPDSPATSRMRDSAMWVLPSTDIDKAVEIFPTLDPVLQNEITWTMAESMAIENPESYNQWVGSLESPELRQNAMLVGEVYIARQNPESWLEGIHSSSGEERANRLYVMYTSVRTEYPDLVNNWMQVNPLSAEDEQLLIQRMQSESYGGHFH